MPFKLFWQYTVEVKVTAVEWHRRNGHNISKTARKWAEVGT